jgi:hypothetical protein
MVLPCFFFFLIRNKELCHKSPGLDSDPTSPILRYFTVEKKRIQRFCVLEMVLALLLRKFTTNFTTK